MSKVSSKTEDAFNSTVSKLENQRAHLNEEVSHLMETLVEELKDCETVHYYPIPDSINSMIYGIDKDSQGNHIVYPNSFERLKAIAAKDFHHIKDTLIEIIRQGPKLKRAAATLMMIRRGGWEVLMRHHPQYSGGTFCFTGATLYSK